LSGPPSDPDNPKNISLLISPVHWPKDREEVKFYFVTDRGQRLSFSFRFNIFKKRIYFYYVSNANETL